MPVDQKLNTEQCMQNRELSWLKFNERVLEEAYCQETPLLDRLKFISIFTTNLDEFFMVRVGGLTDQRMFFPELRENKTNMTAEQQLRAIFRQTAPLYRRRDEVFNQVMGSLSEYGVEQIRLEDMGQSEKKKLEKHFRRNVMPFLSAQIIDSGHPFPHLTNKRLYVAVLLEREENTLFGLMSVPDELERCYYPGEDARFILLEDMIRYYAHLVFNTYTVVESQVISVTRNTDLDFEENLLEEDLDYRQVMKKTLKKRQRLAAVRLECQGPASDQFVRYFTENLKIERDQVFLSGAPLDLSFVFRLDRRLEDDLKGRLVQSPHVPVNTHSAVREGKFIEWAEERDILLAYPFESITPFLSLIRQAASDATVLSIKITLYRLDTHSRLADSLILAAENGKDVMVLLELRARFDEANNIEWAHRLEEAGCRVMYGFPGFKVHSKICLITRRVFGKVQYITQIGTGNYNEKTAGQYTDLSLITANQDIGRDAAAFFHNLQLGNLEGEYDHLWASPHSLKRKLMAKIDEQIQLARRGESGRVIIKCNSLSDREVLDKLIEASQNGVVVGLIVRGICCLTPGVKGLTDNITVMSIVGRFLEHSRIYCFGTGGNKQIYISSADLMTRNTERRVELACPIYQEDLRDRLFQMLDLLLMDNVKARHQRPDGTYYLKKAPADLAICAQEIFRADAAKRKETGVRKAPKRRRFSTAVRHFFAGLRERLFSGK